MGGPDRRRWEDLTVDGELSERLQYRSVIPFGGAVLLKYYSAKVCDKYDALALAALTTQLFLRLGTLSVCHVARPT